MKIKVGSVALPLGRQAAMFCRERYRAGGSALVMAIVLSVVITSLVMVIGWSCSTLTQTGSALTKFDRSYYVAEAGAQTALWRFKHDNTWRATTPMTGTITIDGVAYGYSVTCTGNSGSPVLITSTATSGTGSARSQIHFTVSGGGGTPATVATGGGTTFSSTSLLTVTGDLAVSGSINSSGTFTVSGNVNASGTIDSGVSAAGTKTPFDSTVTVPNVVTIYNSLTSGAYTIASGNITTLDFNAHPVILVNGNASLKMTSATITGVGTLLVNGNVTTGNDIGASGAPLAFNLVTTGTFTATNNWYVTGALYSAGLIKFNNQTVLTGVMVGNAGATLNNHHTFNFGTPPSYDPRNGVMTLTSYGDTVP